MADQIVSFEVGIATLGGRWTAICIKFAFADRKTVLTHWPPLLFKQLTDALIKFWEAIGLSSLMFRAKADPSTVALLPSDHPFHLLLSMRPMLSEEETGSLSKTTTVRTVEFRTDDVSLSMSLDFFNGEKRDYSMHEYTTLSLYGFLLEYMEAAEKLAGPSAGSA